MSQIKDWQSPQQLALLRGWTRDGLTRRQIAAKMGIRSTQLQVWIQRSPEIAQAMSVNGESTDYQVEEALLRAALGYRYTEEKLEQSDKGDKRVLTEKDVSPNVSAISLWLKRRKPEIWDEDTVPVESAENNLFAALGNWEQEVYDANEIPELQPSAAAHHDLVEAP